MFGNATGMNFCAVSTVAVAISSEDASGRAKRQRPDHRNLRATGNGVGIGGSWHCASREAESAEVGTAPR
eukprot:8643874-Alexandrium_andersonii.AAC.1